MSRTKGTEAFYEKKLESIKRNYVQAPNELDSRVGVLEVYERIESVTLTNTAKLYRSVLRWHCRNSGIVLEEGDMRLKREAVVGRKMKAYSAADRHRIIEYVVASGWHNQRAWRFVILHLTVGPLLGYRIAEISNIECVEETNSHYKFRIKNGKATNGRGNGEYRWVSVLKRFGDVDLKDSVAELNAIYQLNGVIESARKLHLKAVEFVYKNQPKNKKRPTLSSTRHEFKMSTHESCGSRECSASMGHVSIATKSRHYGEKRFGSMKHDRELNEFHRNMQVNPENVQAVRDLPKKRVHEADVQRVPKNKV